MMGSAVISATNGRTNEHDPNDILLQKQESETEDSEISEEVATDSKIESGVNFRDE